nr:HD domain-containing protein [Thaumasiovibrio subtropicus]
MLEFEAQFRDFIAKEMVTDAAHDLQHVERVVKTAKMLSEEEGAKLEIVLPAAYLHDCFTYPKDHPKRKESAKMAADKAIDFLRTIQYPDIYLDAIHHAIMAHSFSANVTPLTIEAKVVQDADRLGSLGAIGVARCLFVAVGFGSALYSADDPFAATRALDDKSFTVDHFYTKLFKLESMMQTATAKKEARQRSQFMQDFLTQLSNEINDAT